MSTFMIIYVELCKSKILKEIFIPLSTIIKTLIRYIDPLGKETTYSYNPLDLLVQVCKERNCYSYERNEAGRIIALIDYNGNKWEFLRDVAGFPAGFKDPRGNVLLKEYDNNFRLISVTLPSGDKITYDYDSSGRLIRVNYPDGSYEEFLYDGNGNILKAENQNTSIRIEYDLLNRPVKLIDETLNLEISYKYTLDGWLKEIRYPGKFKVRYKYDRDGNVKRIKFKGGRIRYKYDERGLIKEVRLGRVKIEYEYDKRGLLKEIEIDDKKFGGIYIEYERDKLGRVIK